MSINKITMFMAAALVGAGLFAAEPADAPKPEGGKPAMRGERRGHGGQGQGMQRIMQIFQLNDEEKAALEKDVDATKAQVKAIREKAQADVKAIVEKSFDERLKTLKAAAARLTDEKAKAKAEKMIEMMEQRRDRQIEMQTKRLMSGERPPMREGGRRGPRPQADVE